MLAPKQISRKKEFSSKFYFLSSIWIFKLSASRITKNSSHCYTLNLCSQLSIYIYNLYSIYLGYWFWLWVCTCFTRIYSLTQTYTGLVLLYISILLDNIIFFSYFFFVIIIEKKLFSYEIWCGTVVHNFLQVLNVQGMKSGNF